MAATKALDGNWTKGISSIMLPELIDQGEYAWLLNGDNSGGVISTRQGFNMVGCPDGPLPQSTAKGFAIFKDKNGYITMIVIIDNTIYVTPFPFTSQFRPVYHYFPGPAPVFFCKAFVFNKSIQSTDSDGNPIVTYQAVEPYPILVIQDGFNKAMYYDGTNFFIPKGNSVLPTIPIGNSMEWSGSRLWVASGSQLHASDFGNPLSFLEETEVAGGGALIFDNDIVGLYKTPDQRSLLVGTDFDMSSVASGVFDRAQWIHTPQFQNVFLPGVGLASARSFTRQWGLLVWESHGGMIALDAALNTNISSQIAYMDQGMMREKGMLSKDLSGVVISSYGNSLVAAVPAGSRDNSKIWLLNQRPIDKAEPVVAASYRVPCWSSSWNGIHVVDMTSVVIRGKQRLFALTERDGQPQVFELFTGERMDRVNDVITHPPVVLETRVMGYSDELKRFEYADLDIANAIGTISIQVYVSGRKGTYHQIMDKTINASRGSVNAAITSAVKASAAAAPKNASSLSVDSTNGFLEGPATAFVNGYAFSYTSKTSSRFEGTSLPIDVPARAQVVQPIYSFTPQGFQFQALTTVTNAAPRHSAQLKVVSTDNFRNGPDSAFILTGPDQPERFYYAAKTDVAFTGCDLPISVGTGATIRQDLQVDRPDNTRFKSFVQQRRYLTTASLETNDRIEESGGAESEWADKVDRGFNLLIVWTGIMSLVGARIWLSPEQDRPVGRLEAHEMNSRSLDEGGVSEVSDDILEPDTVTSGETQSQYLPVFTSKPQELDYIAGGLFGSIGTDSIETGVI